jgi:hypothetical protein
MMALAMLPPPMKAMWGVLGIMECSVEGSVGAGQALAKSAWF